MNWLRKAAAWIKNLFVPKAPLTTPEEIVAPLAGTVAPEVKLPPKKATELEKVAREKLALGPSDLKEKISQKLEKFHCAHTPVVAKQVWTKVAPGRFELQNEVICTKCKESKIQPIR